ncbi:MAG: VOC family protein, partial [Anaerolineae bacterium]
VKPKMLVRGVDMVIVFVSDMDRSLAWYEQVLGLVPKVRHGDWATFDLPGTTLALHATGDMPTGGQRTMACFDVEDYAAAKSDLEAKGCRFVFENSTPASIFGTFTDPDGTQLQILQRQPAT